FDADHASVGFLYFGKRKAFDHGADAGEFREAHGLFGIRSGSRGPALNGFASSDHEHSRNLERVAAGADNHELSVRAEAGDQLRHSFAVRRSGKKHMRPAKIIVSMGDVGGTGNNVR